MKEYTIPVAKLPVGPLEWAECPTGLYAVDRNGQVFNLTQQRNFQRRRTAPRRRSSVFDTLRKLVSK